MLKYILPAALGLIPVRWLKKLIPVEREEWGRSSWPRPTGSAFSELLHSSTGPG